MRRSHRMFFMILYALVFGSICYKVFSVPITHDEPATALYYFQFSPWDIMMYPDPWPNNHILNTLLTKGSIHLLGKEVWAMRLPNLLSFPLYAFGVFRLLKMTVRNNTLLFTGASLLFIANPYLLDFFGLCRGYGMATALAVCSVSYLVSGHSRDKVRHIWIAFITGLLAAYANFTLLTFAFAISSMVILYFWLRSSSRLSNTGTVALLLIAYAALIYSPIRKMQGTNQFKYWDADGFFANTVLSLVQDWRYGSDFILIPSDKFLAYAGVLLLLGNLIYIAYLWWKNSFEYRIYNRPNTLLTTLLTLTIIISISQSLLLGTPNLSGRTALFFYPLYISFLSSLLSLLSRSDYKRVFEYSGLVIGIVFFLHLADRYDPDSVREWWFDQYSKEVIRYIDQHSPGDSVTLKTDWHFHRSLHFYAETGKAEGIDVLPYDKSIRPDSDADYYYIFSQSYDKLSGGFEPVKKFSDSLWLLRRRE